MVHTKRRCTAYTNLDGLEAATAVAVSALAPTPAPTPAPTTTPTPLPTTATATTPTPIATTPAAGTKASQLATLTDEVFAEKFAMSRIEFSALPKWKQQNALKKQNLF